MDYSWRQWHKRSIQAIIAYSLWPSRLALGQSLPMPLNPLPTPNQETLPQSIPSEPPQIRLSPEPPSLSCPIRTNPASESFQIDGVQVIGNTRFKAEIQQLIAPFRDRRVTLDDLLNLRTQITTLYQNAGYISSGAFLLKQPLDGGTIRIQVVESQMESVEIRGLKRLKRSYIRDRLKSALTSPLNQTEIEQALQRLQQDPLLDQVAAKLSAGSGPGLNRLDLDLQEAKSKTLALQIDNHQAPAIGEIGGTVELEERNLTGRGDRIQASYTRTDGLNQYDASYQIPFNAKQGTLEVRFRKNDTTIIAEDFQDLNIQSQTDTFSLEIRQPIIRHPNQELAVGARFEVRNNQTQIENAEFSFQENAEDGRTRVRPIRLYADWTKSQANSLIALRSQLSLGLDWLGSSNQFEGASGTFFSWLGQAQWVKRLPNDILLLSTANLQLTPNELLALEQYSLGGRNSVRGYLQNYRLGDNGINGTFEARIPVNIPLGSLSINPFFDAGAVWNQSSPTPEDSVLASLGVDLSWQPLEVLIIQAGYGLPLLSDSPSRGAIQDSGFTFVVRTEHQF